ncbi:hypothetical protein O1W68_04945 [Rhodococcus sp. H36-A4]|uniref:hypothetical protein n=1 Tax=Rhodococcus sp. H36-A4 TaxID=3004353 RepID=UPI0022AE8A31|nr:hypothetical protein [Rhodococcus sp. H36-A4]MCZ4077282.1 hypothetical protein [Rhodococcus sp. H36-A4]
MINRFGEEIEEQSRDDRPHDPRCRKGWLGYDLDGRPIPCLQCRPHLRKTADVYDSGDRAS